MQRFADHKGGIKKLKVSKWINEQSNAPTFEILSAHKTARTAYFAERKTIRKYAPRFNVNHTKRKKPSGARNAYIKEIDVDCHWDKKYWINCGE